MGKLLVVGITGASWLFALAAAHADDAARSVRPPTSTGAWVFRALPKSLDTNPYVDMTVFGHVTTEGKAAPIPTSGHPIYYEAKSGGLRTEGGTISGEKRLAADQVTKLVAASLHSAGYLPADADHPATLLITYSWGAMYRGLTTSGQRAAMIGSSLFADEYVKLMTEQREQARNTPIIRSSNAGSPINIAQTAFHAFTPIEIYKRNNENNSALLEQVNSDLYFIVISAFDQKAIEEKRLIRLWRTHMTIDASGVSAAETLPVAIANASPYLGKDTGRPGTLNKHILKKSQVVVGEAEVATYLDTPPAPAKPEGLPRK